MAANIWRRKPSGRIGRDNLVKSKLGSAAAAIAADFFEAPTGPQPALLSAAPKASATASAAATVTATFKPLAATPGAVATATGNFVKGVKLAATAQTVATLAQDLASDPLLSKVSALFKFDTVGSPTTLTSVGSSDSVAGLPSTLTLGGATVSAAQSKFGGASLLLAPGTLTDARFSKTVQNVWSNAEGTIEMWIYPTSIASAPYLYCVSWSSTGVYTNDHAAYIKINADGSVTVFVGGLSATSAAGVITTNTWKHVALSVSTEFPIPTGPTTTIYLHVGGVQVLSFAGGGDVFSSTSFTQWLGCGPTSGSNLTLNSAYTFTGHIDSVRITDGIPRTKVLGTSILPTAEFPTVGPLYPAAVYDPYAGSIISRSGSHFSTTLARKITDASPAIVANSQNQVHYIDASTAWREIAYGITSTVATDVTVFSPPSVGTTTAQAFPVDYTVEFRVKVDAVVSWESSLFGYFQYNGSNNQTYAQVDVRRLADGRVQAYFGSTTGSTAPQIFTSTSAIAAGTWTTVAFVKQGLTAHLYINGTREATGALASDVFAATFTGDFKYLGFATELGAPTAAVRICSGLFTRVRETSAARYTGASYTVGTTPLPDFTIGADAAASATATADASSYTLIDPIYNLTKLHLRGGDLPRATEWIDSSYSKSQVAVVGVNAEYDYSNSAIRRLGLPPMVFASRAANAISATTEADPVGDFTIEAWINLGVSPTIFQYLFGLTTSGGVSVSVLLGVTTGPKVIAKFGLGSIAFTGTTNFSLGAWHHIAVTRVGTTVYVYLDGLLEATGTEPTRGTLPVQLQYSDSPSSVALFNGLVSELRYTNGTARYSGASYTTPTALFPGLNPVQTTDPLYNSVGAHLHFDGVDGATTFVNSLLYAGVSGSLTRAGATAPTLSSAQAKFGTTSLACAVGATKPTLMFSGTLNPWLSKMTVEFTIEFWAFLNPDVVGTQTLVGQLYPTTVFPGYNVGYGHFDLTAEYVSSGIHKLVLVYPDSASTYTSAATTSAQNITDGVWHHIALCKANGRFTVFVDGVVSSITQPTYTPSVLASMWLTVANRSTASAVVADACQFSGYIDELRVTTACRYSNVFSPPAAPFLQGEASTDPYYDQVVCLHQGTTEAVALPDNSKWAGNKTFSPTPAISPVGWVPRLVEPGTRLGAMFFDGASYVSVPTGAVAIAANEFTIEGWFKPTSLAYQTYLFYKMDTVVEARAYIASSGTSVSCTIGNKTATFPTAGIVANNWYHIAIVRSVNSLRVYLNGVGGTAVDMTAYSVPVGTGVFAVGALKSNATASGWFTGFVSDFRVTVGSARYTAAFTPVFGALPYLDGTGQTQNPIAADLAAAATATAGLDVSGGVGTAPLGADALVVAASTATLLNSLSLTAASAAAATSTVDLAISELLTASPAAQSTSTAALLHAAPLAATPATAATASSALDVVGTGGTAVLCEATPQTVATATAAIAQTTVLASTSSAVVTATAALALNVRLAAVPATVSTSDAALVVGKPVAGAPASIATATAALTNSLPLAAAPAAAATATAAFSLAVPLQAATAAAATATGNVTQSVVLATAAQSVGTATGTLSGAGFKTMAADAAAVATATATIKLSVVLAAVPAATANSTADAAHGVPVAGAAVTLSTATASLTNTRLLAASAAGQASASASLFISQQLAAAAQTTATVTTVLLLGKIMAAVAQAQTGAGAALSTGSAVFLPETKRTATVSADLRTLFAAADPRSVIVPTDNRTTLITSGASALAASA